MHSDASQYAVRPGRILRRLTTQVRKRHVFDVPAPWFTAAQDSAAATLDTLLANGRYTAADVPTRTKFLSLVVVWEPDPTFWTPEDGITGDVTFTNCTTEDLTHPAAWVQSRHGLFVRPGCIAVHALHGPVTVVTGDDGHYYAQVGDVTEGPCHDWEITVHDGTDSPTTFTSLCVAPLDDDTQ